MRAFLSNIIDRRNACPLRDVKSDGKLFVRGAGRKIGGRAGTDRFGPVGICAATHIGRIRRRVGRFGSANAKGLLAEMERENRIGGRKMIYDPELEICISKNKASYDLDRDDFSYEERSVGRHRKNGYLTYNKQGACIGIVYKTDDKRWARYGNAEILFFKKFYEQYGSWRVIKIFGQYLPFDKMEKVLSEKNFFTCVTGGRCRRGTGLAKSPAEDLRCNKKRPAGAIL